MEVVRFEKTGGKSINGYLSIGGKRVSYKLFPLIPLNRRMEMINNIVDSLVFDGSYYANSREFVINYFLLQYYTDIEFMSDNGDMAADTNADNADDNNADDTVERTPMKFNMDVADSVYEIYMTTNVMADLREAIVSFDALMREINDAIDFARDELHYAHGWNKVGDAVANLVDTIGTSFTADDIKDIITALTEAQPVDLTKS